MGRIQCSHLPHRADKKKLDILPLSFCYSALVKHFPLDEQLSAVLTHKRGSIVLTHKPRLHVALNNRSFACGLNCNNSN